MEERNYKLIFTGPMGAGKTTAIGVISEIDPVRTDVENSDVAGCAKAGTTTAMDYGEITLPGGERLRLFGTPGQSRFDYMWKILSTGALGVVILADNSRANPVEDLRAYLEAFSPIIEDSRAVIGIGRTESHPSPSSDAYHELAAELGLALPVLSVDVRERADVLLLLEVLFHQMEAAAGKSKETSC